VTEAAARTSPGQDDLEAGVRRDLPDRWLASRFVGDPDVRADLIALYAFDRELARALSATREPLMAEIRLTWWSETLDEIFGDAAVRRHPVAQALAVAVGRRGLDRSLLEALIDGRLAVLNAAPSDPDGVLTNAALTLLGGDPGAPPSKQPAAAFPAVAHLSLKGKGGGELARRLRLLWAVLRGRV